MLTEMSYYLDVGEQDKALAEPDLQDQATLAALHQTVVDTRDRTEDLRVETAAQKAQLDASLADLKAAKAQLKPLEKRTAKAPRASRRRTTRSSAKKKAPPRRRSPRPRPAQNAELPARSRPEVGQADGQSGEHPVEYNGTLGWPMAGDMTQNVRVHRVLAGSRRSGSCDHFHRGIDIVAPEGTPVEVGRRRDHRLHRLELRRRRRPCLDRRHRPQRGPPDLVRPHAAALSGRHRHRQPRRRRARSSATRATPATRPARTSTGRS